MKKLVYLQTILLLGTVLVGAFLLNEPSATVRMAHRFLGGFSGIVAIITTVQVFRAHAQTNVKVVAAVAALLVIVAGGAGSSIGSPGIDYATALDTMRFCGFLAFLGSVALVILTKGR